tara:strand:+ start:99 stop:434 length:336 start_codon:yes stop_codon:yes gene_type:complete
MKKMRFFLKIKLISFFETHDFCNTIPLIFNAKIGLALTLVVMVIVFLKGPCLFVSWRIIILLYSFVAIRPSGLSGTVHPQLDYIFLIIKGTFPVLEKMKNRSPLRLYSMVP